VVNQKQVHNMGKVVAVKEPKKWSKLKKLSRSAGLTDHRMTDKDGSRGLAPPRGAHERRRWWRDRGVPARLKDWDIGKTCSHWRTQKAWSQQKAVTCAGEAADHLKT
jgi:hypothetical protein